LGYGNWLEERQLDFPADVVYENLVGVFAQSGYKIDKSDAAARGVIASGIIWWSFVASGPIRIAASVTPNGDQAAIVTIESGLRRADVSACPGIGRTSSRHCRR
jgi:hypothetical protein